MGTQIALAEHLKSRSLIGLFTSNRYDKTAKYAAERGFALSIAADNYKVAACTPESIGRCIIDIGILGVSLSPTLKQAYLIPYKKNCTVSISYMGMEQIAYRTGMVVNIQTNIVRKGDTFKAFVKDNRRQILHEELTTGQRGEVTHAYCIGTYKNGHSHVEVMDREQIMAVRGAAAKKNDGNIPFTWVKSNPFRYEMYKKAVMRRAWKSWPKTPSVENTRVLDAVERMDPVDFTRGQPVDEKTGDTSVTLTDKMIGDLCTIMEDAGVKIGVHDRWLNGLASHFGFPKYEAIPADRYDEIKAQLEDSCEKFKARKSQGTTNE